MIKIILITIIFVILSIGFGYNWKIDECTVPKQRFIKQNLSGTVNIKFIDTKNHNNPTIILNNSKLILTTDLQRTIYSSINVGDSIYKKSNSRILKLIKKNGKILIFKETEVDCDFMFDN